MHGKGWRRARPDYPAGIMAVYDSGPVREVDRYTVVYTPETIGGDGTPTPAEVWVSFATIDADGAGCHGESRLWDRPRASGWGNYPGAGKVIAYDALPEDVKAYVQRDLTEWDLEPAPLPQFYQCGGCTAYHSVTFSGDCREDAARLNPEDLDKQYGMLGWEEVGVCAICGTPGRTTNMPSDGHETIEMCSACFVKASPKGN